MLSLGASRPWEDAMEVLTGQRDIDAGPLMEFFQPILDWLTEENRGHKVGWDETKCPEGSFVMTSSGCQFYPWTLSMLLVMLLNLLYHF